MEEGSLEMRTTTGPLETMPTWDHEVAVVVVEGSEAEEASGAEVVALEEASEEVVEDLEVEEVRGSLAVLSKFFNLSLLFRQRRFPRKARW